MQKLKTSIGVFALCLLFSFNLRHALNDYGVSDPNNELHPQVLAQTNTAGDVGGGSGGSSGGGTPCGGPLHIRTARCEARNPYNCRDEYACR